LLDPTESNPLTRQARQISSTGIYHIMFRGVSHCHIFEDTDDYLKLCDILSSVKSEMGFKIPAYCLMDNHVHLMLIEDQPARLPLFMKKVLVRYVAWFNRRHQRSGVLMENRYRSECVTDEPYTLAVIRYIHLNPCVAGIVAMPGAYRWSSYSDYLSDSGGLADMTWALSMFSQDEEQARSGFIAFHENEPVEKIEIATSTKLTEEQLRKEMLVTLSAESSLPEIYSLFDIASLKRPQRNAMLTVLRQRGFSIRQIERATGISRGIIAKC
jgi:REP element-mobilizing transposase RayT